MRRKSRSKITGMEFGKPVRKESKNSCAHPQFTHHGKLLDEDTYKRHKQALVKEVNYKNKDSIRILMRETAANRRQWILDDRPSVAEVKKCFPCISEFQFVSLHLTI